MTPKELIIASQGWGEKQKDIRLYHEYLARRISYQIYCGIPVKGKHVGIDTYWPIKEENAVIPTKEERQKAYESVKWLK